jgi:hypothetical protein
MAAADYRLLTDATGQRIAVALEAFQAVPYVATIPTGQWSGSGSDWYITVQASNVTANSLLVPHYDSASEALLNGPIWCVPAAGSFTIHTSAIPAGTVTVMVQLLGTLGEAQYQVLADVYSTSQVDSIVAQSTANIDRLNTYVKRYVGKSFSIPGFGDYNIALACLFVEGVGTSICSIQTISNGAYITHLAGTQNATNAISVTNSNGTLTVSTSNVSLTLTFINANMKV